MSKVIRHPRFLAVVFGSITLGLAMVWLVTLSVSPSPARATEGPTPATPDEARILLHRAGLSPDALAAAGVEPADAGRAVSAAVAHIRSAIADLRTADDAAAAATAQVDTLRALAQRGLASQQDLQDLAQARAAHSAALATQAARLAAVAAAAGEHLTQQQLDTLAALAAAPLRAEPALGAVMRTDADWLAIRTALANERIAAAAGETPHEACQDLLEAVRGDNAVTHAAHNLHHNLGGVQSHWAQAVENIMND